MNLLLSAGENLVNFASCTFSFNLFAESFYLVFPLLHCYDYFILCNNNKNIVSNQVNKLIYDT